MKREIKFRAWDELNKIMHFDFQFIKSGDEDNDWIIFISDKQPLGWDEIREQSKPYPFNNPFFAQQLQIMQFTGLKDKNRKEIYEGDIVSCNDIIVAVTWKDAAFHIITNESQGASIFVQDRAKHFEVIGNIYENPELL